MKMKKLLHLILTLVMAFSMISGSLVAFADNLANSTNPTGLSALSADQSAPFTLSVPEGAVQGYYAMSRFNDMTFVQGGWSAEGSNDADRVAATTARWNQSIRAGGPRLLNPIEINWTADEGAARPTLGFRVTTDVVGGNPRLYAYDNPAGTGLEYVGSVWNVLANMAYIAPGGGGHNAVHHSPLCNVGKSGFWGPIGGRDISNGGWAGERASARQFYFFADEPGTYTITVSLVDVISGAVLGTEAITVVVDDVPDVGDEQFRTNLMYFPQLWDDATGRTAPVFQHSTALTAGRNPYNIFEEVFVEVPVDTDHDGRRDLIRVTIRRPLETELFEGLRLPVFYEMSPYRDGTRNLPFYSVNEPRPPGPVTSHFTYANDIESITPRAADWVWGAGASHFNYDTRQWVSGHRADLGPTIGNGQAGTGRLMTDIPAAREALYGMATEVNHTPFPYGVVGGTFGQFMFVRGYINVSSNSVGNMHSEGIVSCGDVDETLVAVAVINWLNGKEGVRAFTCQLALYEVSATDWASGTVVMSGTSYNGTIPIAAAATGVEGLNAIIPIAAISTWYDYYRQNGTVRYPGRNNPSHNGFPGEEFDDLAILCFSRAIVPPSGRQLPSSAAYWDVSTGLQARYIERMQELTDGQDMQTGNYNRFMDDRNYMATADRIHAGIIVQHGFEDFNVDPSHFDKLYRAVKSESDAEIRMVLHRGGHSGISTHEAFFDWAHLWLDHYLNGVTTNNALDMPEVQIIDSLTGQYESFDSWPIPDSQYRRYFLDPAGPGAAGSFSATAPGRHEFVIQDSLQDRWDTSTQPDNTFRPWPLATGSYTNLGRNLPSGPFINNWERRIFNVGNLAAPSTERIAFVTDITENVRMSGTIVVSLEAHINHELIDNGTLSAAIIEVNSGPQGRSPGTTSNVRNVGGHNGLGNINLVRPNPPGRIARTAQWGTYRLITSASADIQNPNTDIISAEEAASRGLPGPRGRTWMEAEATNFVPNQYFQSILPEPGVSNVYTFVFETNDWEFEVGNQMAIMIYTTDYRYTWTPPNPPEVTIITGPNTFIDIPSVQGFRTQPATGASADQAIVDSAILQLDTYFSTIDEITVFGGEAASDAAKAAAVQAYLAALPFVSELGVVIAVAPGDGNWAVTVSRGLAAGSTAVEVTQFVNTDQGSVEEAIALIEDLGVIDVIAVAQGEGADDAAKAAAIQAYLEDIPGMDALGVTISVAAADEDWAVTVSRAGASATTSVVVALFIGEGPVTSLRMNLNAITRVSRDSTLPDITFTVNHEASSQDVILSVSNPAMASIGPDGRSVVTFERAGTVTLAAIDPESGIRHSVTLMIT